MDMFKIVTFVPVKDAEKVRQAMGDAGAGVWRNYHHASFSSRGIGRFTPGKGAHPAIGEIGKPEEVEEERIEVICQKEKVKEVVVAIKKTHPYEEIPLEIYELIDLDQINFAKVAKESAGILDPKIYPHFSTSKKVSFYIRSFRKKNDLNH